jgi:hypothetical protein
LASPRRGGIAILKTVPTRPWFARNVGLGVNIDGATRPDGRFIRLAEPVRRRFMKRILVLGGAFLFLSMVSGCSSDPQSDAIEGIDQLMGAASGDIGNIGSEVEKALKKHDKEKAPLDLTEAGKMANKLKETGEKLQQLKVKQIDKVKVADTEEKDELARKYKTRITTAFTELLDAKKKLNEKLLQAENIDKDKVEELRTKIREAEGPFEAMARQG